MEKKQEVMILRVTLEGRTDIMFDRYGGKENQKLTIRQKFYVKPGTSQLVLPSLNVMSFLSAENTESAPKRIFPAKTYKLIAKACKSNVSISPQHIPFLRDGNPIEFGEFNDEGFDPKSGIYIHRSVARLPKGIPNDKERPTLPVPWSLAFEITYYVHRDCTENQLKTCFEEGGATIGLGTYRGVFGKFKVSEWERMN